MHYNTVRDAAFGAALIVRVDFWEPWNILQVLGIYITAFWLLFFALEAAKDWEERRRKQHDGKRI